MPSDSPDLVSLEKTETTPAPTGPYWLQALAVTLAVVLGPLVTILYHQTQSEDAPLGSFSLSQVIRGLLCALMLLSLFFSRGLRRLTHPFARPLLFLAAYALLTAWAGPYPYQNIVFAVKMAFITLVFVVTLRLAEEGWVRERWLAACAWVILLTVVACIGIGLRTGHAFDLYGSRYATVGPLASGAGCFILSTLPVFIRYLAVARSALVGLILLHALLFFIMCRSTLIAAVAATCGVIFINLCSRRSRMPWRRILIAAAGLALLAGLGLNTPVGAEVITRLKELNPHEGTGSGRYIFWRITLEYILHRPLAAQLWGEGMGSIRDLLQARFGMYIGAHNEWLDFVHAFGWCGLIGLGWWYGELVRLVWHLHGRPGGPFQGACALAIMLGLISIGTGGSLDPVWALDYAAVGFWVGCATRVQRPGTAPVD
jgi:hypothetical protein